MMNKHCHQRRPTAGSLDSEISGRRRSLSTGTAVAMVVQVHLETASTEAGLSLELFIDKFIATPEVARGCTAGAELFTAVQPPPWEVPLLPVGGRAVARIREDNNVTCNCDYFRNPPSIKLHKKGGPGIKSGLLAEFMGNTWMVAGDVGIVGGMNNEQFSKFLNTRADI